MFVLKIHLFEIVKQLRVLQIHFAFTIDKTRLKCENGNGKMLCVL